MRLWLLLAGALLVQEIASTNVALLSAHRAGYSAFLIALIFVLATALDFAMGYLLGRYVQRAFAEHRFIKKIERWALRFEKYLGPKSERAMLLLIGLVSFSYVNAFLASWLTLAPIEALAWLAVGDMVWYALEWLIVLGVANLATNFTNELYFIVAGSIIFIVALRFIANRIFKET